MKIMKGKSLTGIGKHALKVVDQSLKNLTRRFKDKSSKTTCVCNKQLGDTKQKDVKYVTKVKHGWGVKIKGCQNVFEFEINLK